MCVLLGVRQESQTFRDTGIGHRSVSQTSWSGSSQNRKKPADLSDLEFTPLALAIPLQIRCSLFSARPCAPVLGTALSGFRSCNPPWLRLIKDLGTISH